MINCPHCQHELTAEELKTLWGRWRASLSTPHPGPGRPKYKKPCPCGKMTAERAKLRNHVCVAPKRRGRPAKKAA